MNRIKLGMCVLLLIFGLAGSAFADTVTVNATDSLNIDGTSYSLVSDSYEGGGLMWEPSGTSYKACLCRMVAYGALQAVAGYLGITDLTSSEISIVTGWNTDGPEELYELMGWTGTNFSYAQNMTDNASLTLADAWFEFTINGTTYRVTSSALNYEFTVDGTESGYVEDYDFFDYRSYVKNGGTGATKSLFSSNIRDQIADNLSGVTYFDVQAVPVPGTAFLMASGLLGLSAMNRKRK